MVRTGGGELSSGRSSVESPARTSLDLGTVIGNANLRQCDIVQYLIDMAMMAFYTDKFVRRVIGCVRVPISAVLENYALRVLIWLSLIHLHDFYPLPLISIIPP